MIKKRVNRFFKRLNPKELATEVHVYGYDFSWKIHVQVLFYSLLAMGAVGILFQLKVEYFVLLMFFIFFLLPVFILYTYQRMFEQKRFADATVYVEQMLYSFQKREKVVSALKETNEVFEEGRMKWALEDAIAHFEAGIANSEKGTAREALAIIEHAYPCMKIHVAHELFLSSEEYGGEAENSILLLLEDTEHWKRRSYQLQADKKRSHVDNIISIVVATTMCAIALYVLNAMKDLFPGVEGINIFTIEVIQLSSFLFIIFMLLALMKSMKNLTTNWLQDGELQKQEYLETCYEIVLNYDKKKWKKRNFLVGSGCLLVAIQAFYVEKIWIAIIAFLLGGLMLTKHRVNYHIARKDLNEAIYITLPQWLMELALLLQNNNVQVSIAKSIPNASPILQRELEKLMDRLQRNPDKLSSYTDFCKEFDVPETQSVMKMLHAIAESGTGNAALQIKNLIYCTQKMQTTADEIRNRNTALRMKIIFSYPVLAATVKLLIDLSVGMLYMFQLLGSIGGI